ncbi:MAG: hypothetical protein U9R44_00655 [Candidatus Omnitrophota bacterium]|nr:hypothetical protein [Candidatus Omnitrophota bacterium]
MGIKDRKKIKVKQKVKRREKRRKLLEKGLSPDDFFHGKFYVGHKGDAGA